jgi:MFS transporter, FHS family, L-fucose permease
MTTSSTAKQSQLFSIIIVFFFWGFVAASNGIFIPFCKHYFSLSQFQSQLIDLTFYGGYFIGSLVLFIYGRLTHTEWLNKIGYKRGTIYGLLLSSLGAFSMLISVSIGSYGFILTSYFLVALGFSLQQTCVQPFVIALGPAESGATRLNLAGGINSLGTTLAPIAVSFILFGQSSATDSAPSIGLMSSLYLGVALLFAAMAAFFHFSSLPNITAEASIEKGLGALQFPQLTYGMAAIFVYVGVEVSIQSNMGALLQLPEFGSLPPSHISPYISMYWGSLMIGRWANAIGVFATKGWLKRLLQVVVPFMAFGLVLISNKLNGHSVDALYAYTLPILLMIGISILSAEQQQRSLWYFSLFGAAAMLVGLCTQGTVAVYAFLTGGLACSVLWPCIFSLALSGLGKYASQGSALLIMMIAGGAIIPPLQGLLADIPQVGIHYSYIVALCCFVYLAFYALKVKRFANA